jgi:hypothetical protein
MAGVPDDHAEESVASWSGLKTILSILEETMKINLVAALAGSAISFALATSAQQKDTVDPNLNSKFVRWLRSMTRQ